MKFNLGMGSGAGNKKAAAGEQVKKALWSFRVTHIRLDSQSTRNPVVLLNSLEKALVSAGSALLFLATFGSMGLEAASIDAESRASLIAKLTTVYLNLAPKDLARNPVALRLADLHTEKARQEALEEGNKGCVGACTAGLEDRKKAIGYYKEVLPTLKDNSAYRVKMQIGHLSEVVGKEKESLTTFEELLSSPAPDEYKAEAALALGEFYYRRQKFPLAKTYFDQLVSNPKAVSRGLAAYRTAWCELNSGKPEAGVAVLRKILLDPKLLSRNSIAEDAQIDPSFHEEVSRDFVTFQARLSFSEKAASQAAEEIYKLSPEKTKVLNTVYFANELERTGQRESALVVWRQALEVQTSPLARLESQVHITHLLVQLGKRDQARGELEKALRLWPSVQPCSDADLCKELKSRMKGFLVAWNKAEGQTPSAELLASYKLYLEQFAESDVTLWAAKVATGLKMYKEAFDLYTASTQIAGVTADQKEVGLVGAMETAELSGSAELKIQGYSQYLSQSKDKSREYEVRYQKAKLIYDQGSYAEAAIALKDFALLNAKSQEKLQKQAADLSLDALAILQKDAKTSAQADADLENWSKLYAQHFPSHAAEFYGILRTSILNQMERAGKPGTTESLEKAWQILSRYDLSSSTPKDLVVYFKNRLVLAEKLHKFPEAREASDRLLILEGVTDSDREFALSRKAWLSELILDFDGALTATQKMSLNKSADYYLKLALYADLAGRDSKNFYREYLKVSQDSEKKALIAAELIRGSPEAQRQQEFEKMRALVVGKPELVAQLTLEIYDLKKDEKFLKRQLSVPGVSATAAGKLLERSLLLDSYEKIKKELAAHKLDSSQEKKMIATLKKRVELLEQSEKLAAQAVKSADWTAQVLSLQLLGHESDRFYQELMSLPVPAGLAGAQEQEYLGMLAQQASPYQIKAADIGKKLPEFWQAQAVQTIQNDLDKSLGATSRFLTREVKLLATVAPESLKPNLVTLAQGRSLLVQANSEVRADVESARKEVRENPLSSEKLLKLQSVERSLGHDKMVTYLEGRLLTLKESDGQNKSEERGNQ